MFVENRQLYGMKGPMPPDDHLVPIGVAALRRPGSHVTVVSWSRMVHDALQAAEQLAEEGIDVEVIDLRTVAPIDLDTVAASVSRTGRLLIAHEAVQSGGVGAELATLVTERCFFDLDAPIARLAPTHAPVPVRAEPRAGVAAGRRRDRRGGSTLGTVLSRESAVPVSSMNAIGSIQLTRTAASSGRPLGGQYTIEPEVP